MAANDDLLDAQVRHQIGLQRLARRLTAEINDVLAESEPDIRKALSKVDRRTSWRDLQRILAEVRDINRAAYDVVEVLMLEHLRHLAEYEAEFQRKATRRAMPAPVRRAWEFRMPKGLGARVPRVPINGFTVREHVDAMADGRYRRIAAAVRRAWMEGAASVR